MAHPSPTARMIPCMACCFGGVLCSKLSGRYAFFSIQNVPCAKQFNRAIHKARCKVKEVCSEVLTTVHGSNPLAEKIQEGFDKETVV